MDTKQTYYQILGISMDATQEEIKKAYKKMAWKYHPDISHEAEEKMSEINEAYETLSNVEKRKIYDKTVLQVENKNNQKAYDSYTKTKEESEEDLDDWLKNYLKIQRNLNKLIDEYVKIESANARAQKYYYTVSNEKVLYSKLLLVEIAKLFNTMYVSAKTNPEKILEYLLTEIASLAEKIEFANTQYREATEETQIRFRLFVTEIALFQKNYICEGKEGYDSVLKYVLKKYLKIQESNAFYRHEFRKIPYSNTLQLEILEKIMKENQEYINKLLANSDKKSYK